MFGFKKDDFSQKAITKAWRFQELIKAVTHYQLQEVESSERDMGKASLIVARVKFEPEFKSRVKFESIFFSHFFSQ